MAATNITFNRTLHHGQDLSRYLNDLDRVNNANGRLLAVMQHMIDGDGSDAAHFTEVTARYGFASNAKAKEAWDELNSLIAKLTTNGSVTNVQAAINQLLAKFG